MNVVVQKYGGTSVADVERIKKVARRVKSTIQAGSGVVVVVSARRSHKSVDRPCQVIQKIHLKESLIC